jgi:hypothetical protein
MAGWQTSHRLARRGSDGQGATPGADVDHAVERASCDEQRTHSRLDLLGSRVVNLRLAELQLARAVSNLSFVDGKYVEVSFICSSGCHGWLSAPEFTALRFRIARQSRFSPRG